MCAQTLDYWKNNWNKIIITDAYYKSHGGGFSINRYQITKKEYELTLLNNKDSILSIIKPDLIDSLFSEFQIQKKSRLDPLKMFNKKPDWLVNNAEFLWKEYWYRWKEKKNTIIDSIAISTFKDKSITSDIISSLQGMRSGYDIPVVFFNIATNKDTLRIGSAGQYPYMLPWYVDKKEIFNSKISTIISEILPDKTVINKDRLKGKKFNFTLSNSIYKEHLKDKINYIQFKQKYRKQFRFLEKEFKIKEVVAGDMSSIEWGGDMGKRCLEIILLGKYRSNKIQFSTIFNINPFFFSPRSFLKNKENLMKRLEENPVYNYVLNCEDCLGEIHWVKSKSLSNEAKQNFIEDLMRQGMDKDKYKGTFKNAIFFELTEVREENRSFSRWIFLEDGTLILWQLRGGFLMNVSKELIKEKGYVCLEIKGEDLNVK